MKINSDAIEDLGQSPAGAVLRPSVSQIIHGREPRHLGNPGQPAASAA
jgi:hypothetical protein